MADEPTPDKKPLKRKIVSVQFKDEEVDRWDELEKIAKQRNKLADRSALLREMLGLEDFGLTTPADRLRFQGKAGDGGNGGGQIIPRTSKKSIRDIQPAAEKTATKAVPKRSSPKRQ